MVAVRRDEVITLEEVSSTTDVVTRDFTGRERVRVKLAPMGSAVPFTSRRPPGDDRSIVGSRPHDRRSLDGGSVQILEHDLLHFRRPVIWSWSAMVYSAPRMAPVSQTVSDTSRLAWTDARVLSPDGRRAVSIAVRACHPDGRAVARYRRGPRPALTSRRVPPAPPIDHLALSRDGSLLVSNVLAFAAFAFEVAPRFGDSRVAWSASLEVNLEVDVSADGKTVALAGDGRALYGGVDGRFVWQSPPPPAAVGPDICLPIRMRFSPKMTWLAGNNYSRVLEVFDVRDLSGGTPPAPLVQLAAGCDAVAFSRDERLMATSGGALYRTAPGADGWLKLWSVAVPTPPKDNNLISDGWANDVSFSPDETQLLVSRCTQTSCRLNLLSVETGAIARGLPELQAPHPSFSPDGSWIVAGGTLLHLPSGDVRELDPGGGDDDRAVRARRRHHRRLGRRRPDPLLPEPLSSCSVARHESAGLSHDFRRTSRAIAGTPRQLRHMHLPVLDSAAP